MPKILSFNSHPIILHRPMLSLFIVSTGKIVIANGAACKLPGYSQKEILTKKRGDIFDVKAPLLQ